MAIDAAAVDLEPALEDLQDAFARVRAQVHVIRLAVGSARDERDLRALMSSLAGIEDELRQAERLLRH